MAPRLEFCPPTSRREWFFYIYNCRKTRCPVPSPYSPLAFPMRSRSVTPIPPLRSTKRGHDIIHRRSLGRRLSSALSATLVVFITPTTWLSIKYAAPPLGDALRIGAPCGSGRLACFEYQAFSVFSLRNEFCLFLIYPVDSDQPVPPDSTRSNVRVPENYRRTSILRMWLWQVLCTI